MSQIFLRALIPGLLLIAIPVEAQEQTAPPKTPSTDPATPETSEASKQKVAMTSADSEFLFEALKGSREEMVAAKAAMKKSNSSQVKEFAQVLLTDHKSAVEKLRKIAKRGGTQTVKKSGTGLNSQLAALQGPEFDKEFASQMVKDHETTIAMFEKSEKSVTNPELQSFISSTLPTLREHLQKAQALNP